MHPDEMKAGVRTPFGGVAEVLATSPVMFTGWELDYAAWLVRLEDGAVRLLTTNHGRVCGMPADELAERIRETEHCASQLRALQARAGELCA